MDDFCTHWMPVSMHCPECLDMTGYDEIEAEAYAAAKKLEEWANSKGLNVRAKYIEEQIDRFRQSVQWMHENGRG